MKLTLKRIVELEAYAHGYWQGEVPPEEFCALLDSARALARLEEWLATSIDRIASVRRCGIALTDDRRARRFEGEGDGPDLAAAINAALDKAKEGKQP